MSRAIVDATPMPKLPALAIFACESCGRASTANARMATRLLPFMRNLPIHADGSCRRCGGDRWTITAVFSETTVELDTSPLAIGLAVAVGGGLVKNSTASMRSVYPGVPASMIAEINERPATRMARVAEFVRLIDRNKFLDKGGIECRNCQALFVPVLEQAWHQAGCCSRMCLVQTQGVEFVAASQPSSAMPQQRVKAITAICAAGHEFEVAASFAGMLRPCPQCGQKTLVRG